MSTVPDQVLFIDEFAEFLLSSPSRDELLAYHPSELVETRFEELLRKDREDGLTADEKAEMEQFRQTEILIRLLKARAHATT